MGPGEFTAPATRRRFGLTSGDNLSPFPMAEPARQLVVIGASAGGIEALSMLVGTLPEGFLAPIVIAQHLDPTRLSHLHSILARKSTLPVRTVTDTEHLEAGV